MHIKTKFVPILIFITLFTLTCNSNYSDIPTVYVNFSVNLNDPDFLDLNAPGNYVLVNGGVRGIILYRKSSDEILAFDRNCSYDPLEPCAQVLPMPDEYLIFEDTCCGSKYSVVLDGYPTDGPAAAPLKQYYVSYNSGSETAYISN